MRRNPSPAATRTDKVRSAPHRTPTASKCHRVIPWEDVSGSEGTGIVHIAPGCGKEDYELSKVHDLVCISPLDDGGKYIDGFGPFTGRSD